MKHTEVNKMGRKKETRTKENMLLAVMVCLTITAVVGIIASAATSNELQQYTKHILIMTATTYLIVIVLTAMGKFDEKE